MADIFVDIGLILIIATGFAFLARVLKQPLIPAYVLAGIMLGPVLGIVENSSLIQSLSEIGIAFLLFIVGLEIDIRKLKSVGMVATLGGLIQISLLFSLGFILAILLGFVVLEAVYLALIIVFSSTMVVIKLLSDKKEIDTLHGKIVIGILLLQDIVAIIALSALTQVNNFSAAAIIISVAKGVVALVIAYLIGKFVMPKVFSVAARNSELLFISAVSASFLYAILFHLLEFSIAIGAFIAGVSLANLPYNIQIIGKIKPLRDFFSVMFFVSLGIGLTIGLMGSFMIPFLVLLILVIFFKPLIMMFTTAFFGYTKRVSFLTAIHLPQISEFSLIVVALGLSLGHISQEIFTLTVMLAVATIVLTTYFTKYEERLYGSLRDSLGLFERLSEDASELEYLPPTKKYDAILAGYNRVGYGIAKTLLKGKKKLLIVDYDPETIQQLIKDKVPCLYGDIGNEEILDRIDFKKTKVVISTVPTKQDNHALIETAKHHNKKAKVFVLATTVADALDLYDAGADYVVLPHYLGGEHMSLLLENFKDTEKLISHKLNHIHELHEHYKLGLGHAAHRSHGAKQL